MVRAGEVSARELVETLARADRGAQPRAQRVRRGRRRAARSPPPTTIGPATSARSPASRSRSRTTAPVAGLRLTYGCSLMADHVADYDHNVTRRLRDAGFVIVGTTTLPEYGILPVTEARLFGPTRNPWDLERTPGGSSGGAAAAVAAGHGAGRARQRRRRLDPDPRRLLRAGRAEAEPRADLGGARARRLLAGRSTACSRAPSPTRRRSSTCSPATSPATPPGRRRRPSRSRDAAAARAAGAADRRHARRPPVADATSSTRSARARSPSAAELLRSLGHEVEEVDPPWQAGRPARAVRRGLLRADRALDRLLRRASPAREPERRGHGADELGDLLDGRRSWARSSSRPRPCSCRPFARRLVAFLAPLRRAAHARARRAPAAARDARHGRAETRCRRSPARACSRRSRRSSTPPASPASRCRCTRARTGCRSACSSSGAPAGEERLLALATQLEAAQPWAARRAPVGEWVS